ncbi:DUF4430 domain-containing protein [Patescibacteria group bacterium]
MRKNIYYLITIFTIVGVGILYKNINNQDSNLTDRQVEISSNVEKKPLVTSTLVGDGSDLISIKVEAANAYEALTKLTEEKDIKLVTKEYDFGIFVQQIGDKVTGSQLAWIYYVNDKSGDVAADKYELKVGDVVEWKYEKPNY